MKDTPTYPPSLSELAEKYGSDMGPVSTLAKWFRFSMAKEFHHNDPEIGARYRDLAHDISGCFVFQVQYTKSRRDQVAVVHKK